MALTQFERDCIDEIFAENTPKHGKSSAEQKANLDAIKHGTEVERQGQISNYIVASGLDKIAAELQACDDQIAFINNKKAELLLKQTAMNDYVT